MQLKPHVASSKDAFLPKESFKNVSSPRCGLLVTDLLFPHVDAWVIFVWLGFLCFVHPLGDTIKASVVVFLLDMPTPLADNLVPSHIATEFRGQSSQRVKC